MVTDATQQLPPNAGMPKADAGGFIPTMNRMGFMTASLDPFSRQFVDFASNAPGPVLDLGAAYGVATLPALAAGARVCANDVERRHLEVLKRRTPAVDRGRLSLLCGAVPDLCIPEASFNAILAARLLHFFPEKQLLATAEAMARWLVPGGRVFIADDTPWLGNSRGIIALYEQRLRNGEPWPGMIQDVRPYRSVYDYNCPAFFHFFDVNSMRIPFEQAGFRVEICQTFARPDYPPNVQLDGREGIGLIAVMP